MEFIPLRINDEEGICEMSAMATAIVREHFDPIIGKAQNDYMLEKNQSVPAIKKQMGQGYRYFFVDMEGEHIGFLAFFLKKEVLYLSKFYLYKHRRGFGYARRMMDFLVENARAEGRSAIELNVNRNNSACKAYDSLGFHVIRSEKIDIGNGFFMDDYIYHIDV